MKPPFTESTWRKLPRELLHRGRRFNATVWQVTHAGLWVVKDFSETPWFYRWTLGRWTVRHEYRVVAHLQDIAGMPQAPFRLGRSAWGYRLIPGEPIRHLDGTQCDAAFFTRLEEMVTAMHQRGVVHLDLRNARNVLRDAEGRPGIIDFQSAAFTRFWPAAIRRLLQRIDLTGVYKHWLVRDAATLGAERSELLAWQLRWRYLWPFRGYSLPGRRRMYELERKILSDSRARRRER